MSEWMRNGIYFVVGLDGKWSIFSGLNTLSTGAGHPLGDTWHTLELRTRGAAVTASLDGHTVGRVWDHTFIRGWAALSSGFHLTEYVNFSLTTAAVGSDGDPAHAQ